jgi:hypothetical protein
MLSKPRDPPPNDRAGNKGAMSTHGDVGDRGLEKDRHPSETLELFGTRANIAERTVGVVGRYTVGGSIAGECGDCGVREVCGILGLAGSCGAMVRRGVSRGE